MPATAQPPTRVTRPLRENRATDWRVALGAALVIAAAAALAYSNSLAGPFAYDDETSIVYNASIRHLWPLRDVLFPPGHGATVSGRPLLNLTFALNYAFGGVGVRGYHVTNILIHALAGLALFGLVRRTLRGPAVASWLRGSALPVALGCAFVWTVHPLNTEAVSYVAQRAESLMALFYLLALYAFARSAETERGRGWRALAWLACLAGMATKENMVSAPVAILLYDRAFVAGSFASAWRQRRAFYLALASTWIVLAALVWSTGGNRGGTVGFNVGVGWFGYVLTQAPALVRYALLSAWPHPLVFDYGAFTVGNLAEAALPLAAVAALLAASAVALIRYPRLAFIALTALAILAPTSLVPGTTQMIVEHRMYLPLAGLLAGAIAAGVALAGRQACVAALAAGLALILATAARNRVYADALTLWGDTVAKRPENVIARSSYGAALADRGRRAEAIVQDRIALTFNPNHATTLANLGIALTESGRPAEALPFLLRAVASDPNHGNARLNLGVTLDLLGRHEEAVPHYAEAVRISPLLPAAHNDYGDALSRAGRHDEGLAHLRQALELDPNYAEAHFNLAAALVRTGQIDAGKAEFAAGLRLRPHDATARLTWANFLSAQHRRDDALAAYQEALRIDPSSPETHYSYATCLAGSGRYPDAVAEYEEALRLRPDYAQAHNNLANTLAALNRLPDAIAHYEAALRLRPDDPSTHNNLGLAYARSGRIRDAAQEFETAVRLAPDFANARQNLERARAQLSLP